MINKNSIREIVIVGGGTTGWTVAMALATSLKGLNLTIKLIDINKHEQRISIESSLPSSNLFYQAYGFNLQELMKETNATFKLGTEFTDWTVIDKKWFHPFGQHGEQKGFFDFHNLALKIKQLDEGNTFNRYSLTAKAAETSKFCLPPPQQNSILSSLSFSLNLDSSRYSNHLEQKATKLGVTKSVGKISRINSSKNGFISSIVLDNDQQVKGDFFIDCSGTDAEVIDKELNVKYIDWSNSIPCDSIISATFKYSAGDKSHPYAEVLALPNGYLKTTYLQRFIERKYIYSSEHSSETDAKLVLTQQNTDQLIEINGAKKIKLGRRENPWEKNCLAIGSAAGEIAPLHIENMHFVHNAIKRFIQLYPTSKNSLNSAEYNRLTRREFELARDYHLLQFTLSTRDDSDFWRNCRTLEVSDKLVHAVTLFKSHGRQPNYNEDLVTSHNWVSTFIGNGIWPDNAHPLIDALQLDQVSKQLGEMKNSIEAAVNSMPEHLIFIDRFCPSTNKTNL